MGILLGPTLLLTARVLTLADALALSVESDARVQLAHIDDETARLEAVSSVARMMPTLDASSSITRNAREVTVGSPPDERIVVPLYVPAAGVVGRIPLFHSADVPRAISDVMKAAAVSDEMAETREAYLADVALHFLSVVEFDFQIATTKAAGALLDERVRIAMLRVEEGEATTLEVNEARAERARLDADLAALEGGRSEILALLKLRLQIPDDEPLTCDADVPLTRPDVGAFDLSKRGDLIGLERRALAARVDEGAALAAFLPSVDVMANARLQQPTLFNPDPLWWSVQLTLNWTLLGGLSPFGSNRAIGVLDRDRRAMRAEVLSTLAADEARASVVQMVARFQSAEARMRAASLEVDAAKGAVAVIHAQHAEGEVSSFERTFAERRLLDAERAKVTAQFARMKALIAWRRALGKAPLDDGESHG